MRIFLTGLLLCAASSSLAGNDQKMLCRNECHTVYLPPECTYVTDFFGFKTRICNTNRTKTVCEWVCSDPYGPDASK